MAKSKLWKSSDRSISFWRGSYRKRNITRDGFEQGSAPGRAPGWFWKFPGAGPVPGSEIPAIPDFLTSIFAANFSKIGFRSWNCRAMPGCKSPGSENPLGNCPVLTSGFECYEKSLNRKYEWLYWVVWWYSYRDL